MRYIYESGKDRRVMHIQKHTEAGESLNEAICGINLDFDRNINAPYALGRSICKNCCKKVKKE